MKITLSPIVVSSKTKQPPIISLSGLMLNIDGQNIDLSVIEEGGRAESDTDLLIGYVTRDEVTVYYPYSTDIYENLQSKNKEDYIFNITNGTVPCPLKKRVK